MEEYLNLKKYILDLSGSGKLTILEILLTLFVSFLLSMFIYFVYHKSFRGVVYSHNYNLTFVLITMITTLIIMTIRTNVILSLGMVGALSIVRFRTAVKDPLDVAYMFWAIAVGIATGAELFLLSIVGSVIFGLIVFILSRRKIKAMSYLLIIHYQEEASDEVRMRLRRLKYILKSKTVHKDITELTVETRLKDDNTAFVGELSAIQGVQDVALVSYNGDYST